jgi:hypothetical protein
LPAGSIGIQRRKKKNLKKKRKKKFLKIKKSTGFWAYKAAVHVVIFAVWCEPPRFGKLTNVGTHHLGERKKKEKKLQFFELT